MAGQQDFTAQVMQILAHTLPQVRTLGAWLFGSHACGEAAPRSDLDLAVLAERRVDPMALGAAATALERIAGSRVDLVDLRALPSTFQRNASTGLGAVYHFAFMGREMCTLSA